MIPALMDDYVDAAKGRERLLKRLSTSSGLVTSAFTAIACVPAALSSATSFSAGPELPE
jgi:hypothetical protein